MAPIISHLVEDGIVHPVAFDQLDVFESARLFARTEGIIPAPETAHAVHAAVEIARECTAADEEKVILIGFSGHGHFDMSAYDAFMNGDLVASPTGSGSATLPGESRLYC